VELNSCKALFCQFWYQEEEVTTDSELQMYWDIPVKDRGGGIEQVSRNFGS
jgi:hypothetical protein